MPYIEDMLHKKLQFEFRQVRRKWGVFEQIKREDVTIEVGCVHIGDAASCRTYVEQRRSQQALAEEEKRGMNPLLARGDRVLS